MIATTSNPVPAAIMTTNNALNSTANPTPSGNFMSYNNAVPTQQPHQQPVVQQQQQPPQYNPTPMVLNNSNPNNIPQQSCQQQQPQQPVQQDIGSQDDLRYHGTELVMLYDYKAQAPDDLSARRGEIIYADLNNQTVEGWLWAYAPKASKKCGKYGFIPKSYTHTYNRQNTSV
jgi:hypothetical protein